MEVQEYPNYLIYEDGRVFSKKTNIFLKHSLGINGYFNVSLSKDGKRKTKNIHRLIALHYIPNPENKLCIDHIDRNRQNNDICNLRWVTHTENNNNKGKQKNNKNNTSGHRYIYYVKSRDRWLYNKQGYKQKYFKSKIDCLCYKFIFILTKTKI
tara:strand:- start:202 stop:663 length:462 start_codon:yes stop_codon:yes gene_type:complete